jgi:hypothetical protein
LILALPLAACGEDQPAVCGSVDDLKSSVDDAKKVDVTGPDVLTDIQSALKAVEGDFADVKADAKSEFSAPVDTVETSLAALKSSLEQARSAPAADTVAAAAAAVSAFGTAVQTLIDDVKSTC